jgi:uncharacterized SAM-binding protein YcdF (DUF218 family)
MNGLMNRLVNDITNFIFVSDEPQKSDIIFLPGTSSPEIPETAAKLYAKKYAPLILPTGRGSIKNADKFGGVKNKSDIYNKDYKTDCEFYTDVLIQNSVPESAILCEDKSAFTKENAVFSRKITDENNILIKTAIICCKSFHARRCLMYYQLAFPEAEIKVVPVDCFTYEEFQRDNWFLSKKGIDRVLGELNRCGKQFLQEDYFSKILLNEENI